MEINPYYQRRRCSPKTLKFWQYKVYADIRGDSQERVCQKIVGLSKTWIFGLSDATSSSPYEMRPTLLIYYTVLFSPIVAFPLTPKYMTMSGHFTLNFRYYKPQFQQLGYILIVEPIYRIFLFYNVTSRDVRKRTVNTVIRRILWLRDKPKRTTAASRGFLATARLSCFKIVSPCGREFTTRQTRRTKTLS